MTRHIIAEALSSLQSTLWIAFYFYPEPSTILSFKERPLRFKVALVAGLVLFLAFMFANLLVMAALVDKDRAMEQFGTVDAVFDYVDIAGGLVCIVFFIFALRHVRSIPRKP